MLDKRPVHSSRERSAGSHDVLRTGQYRGLGKRGDASPNLKRRTVVDGRDPTDPRLLRNRRIRTGPAAAENTTPDRSAKGTLARTIHERRSAHRMGWHTY